MLIVQLSSLGKNITALSNKVDTLISLPKKIDQDTADVSRLNRNIESLNDRITSNEVRKAWKILLKILHPSLQI